MKQIKQFINCCIPELHENSHHLEKRQKEQQTWV